MTSKQVEKWKKEFLAKQPKQPKTPHEEIMFCIESTNDIVSKILEILEPKRKQHDCPRCKFSWFTE